MLLAVLKTLHLCMYVCSTWRPFVAALATHWSLAVGDGEGIYKEWCSGCGAGDYPLGNCFEKILFTGKLWIIQNAHKMNIDLRANVAKCDHRREFNVFLTPINLVSVICVGGWWTSCDP